MVATAIAAVGAAAAAASAYQGYRSAGAANRNAQDQNALSLQQFMQQRRLQQLQEEQATAPTTDARGNRTEYIPGVGWVERPTEQTRALMAASDNEERLRLTQDAVRGRMRRENNFGRQLNEGAQADATLGSMSQGSQTIDDIRAALAERNVARAISGANDVRSRAGTNALRMGQPAPAALADVARAGQADTRTALAEARADATPQYNERNQQRVGSALNQYNLMASRASAPDDVPFNPTSIDEGLSQTMRSRSNMAPQGLGNAMSLDAPRLAYAEDRTPVALGGIASLMNSLSQNKRLMGLFNSSNTAQTYNPNNRLRDAQYDTSWGT